ncbi:MAG: hypothetical protein L3K07_00245 [Thermoplasmata archaeon]|nr:hypothetical protein [Thermoplasmata archaeon]
MADLGFADLLSVVQTIAIIAALVMTVYFSRRQIQAFTADLETRVLNDIDEKFHRIGEILIEKPQLLPSIYRASGTAAADIPFTYYVLFFCAHIHHMRERKILQDNEWAGWLQWMKNAFQFGDLGKHWVEGRMESWFDPSFRAPTRFGAGSAPHRGRGDVTIEWAGGRRATESH